LPNTARSVAAALLLGTLCAALLHPAPLYAHGMPIPLESWGAWGRRLARCQRVIARNAAVCALRAWEARRACRLAPLHGVPCDEEATDAIVEAARLAAVDAVAPACTDQQAQLLLFLDRREAQLDVVTFCRELEDAVDSAVFLPLAADGEPPPTARRCVESAALASTKLLRRAFDSRQRLLDRIAQQSLSVARKHAMVAASEAAVERDSSGLQLELSGACSPDDFTATYGRDAATFLATIASRADCLAGQTYAQGRLLCPAPVCGNGMREFRPIAEQCDDGNLDAGDGCSPTCTHE
jgi:cysteine-rich repeat protein